MDNSLKAVSGPLILATDLVLLPITGTYDVVKVLAAPEETVSDSDSDFDEFK